MIVPQHSSALSEKCYHCFSSVSFTAPSLFLLWWAELSTSAPDPDVEESEPGASHANREGKGTLSWSLSKLNDKISSPPTTHQFSDLMLLSGGPQHLSVPSKLMFNKNKTLWYLKVCLVGLNRLVRVRERSQFGLKLHFVDPPWLLLSVDTKAEMMIWLIH